MSSVNSLVQNWDLSTLPPLFPEAPSDIPTELFLWILRDFTPDVIAANCSMVSRSWYTTINTSHSLYSYPQRIALWSHIAQSRMDMLNPPEEVQFWQTPTERAVPSSELCHLIDHNDFKSIVEILARYINKRGAELNDPLKIICQNLFNSCDKINIYNKRHNTLLPLEIICWLDENATLHVPDDHPQRQSSLNAFHTLCHDLNKFVITHAFPLPDTISECSVNPLLQLKKVIIRRPQREKALLLTSFFDAYMRRSEPYSDEAKCLDMFVRFHAFLNEYAKKAPYLGDLLSVVRARILFIYFLKEKNREGWEFLDAIPKKDQIPVLTYSIFQFCRREDADEHRELVFTLFDRLLETSPSENIHCILDPSYIFRFHRRMEVTRFIAYLGACTPGHLDEVLLQKYQAWKDRPPNEEG